MVNHPLHRLFVPLFYPFTYYSLIWLNNSLSEWIDITNLCGKNNISGFDGYIVYNPKSKIVCANIMFTPNTGTIANAIVFPDGYKPIGRSPYAVSTIDRMARGYVEANGNMWVQISNTGSPLYISLMFPVA